MDLIVKSKFGDRCVVCISEPNVSHQRAGAIRLDFKADPTAGSVACDCYLLFWWYRYACWEASELNHLFASRLASSCRINSFTSILPLELSRYC